MNTDSVSFTGRVGLSNEKVKVPPRQVNRLSLTQYPPPKLLCFSELRYSPKHNDVAVDKFVGLSGIK